jgi:hypothetical protein
MRVLWSVDSATLGELYDAVTAESVFPEMTYPRRLCEKRVCERRGNLGSTECSARNAILPRVLLQSCLESGIIEATSGFELTKRAAGLPVCR